MNGFWYTACRGPEPERQWVRLVASSGPVEAEQEGYSRSVSYV